MMLFFFFLLALLLTQVSSKEQKLDPLSSIFRILQNKQSLSHDKQISKLLSLSKQIDLYNNNSDLYQGYKHQIFYQVG